MRSPIIAFSLFAAVGPSLVSAAPAPQSPRLGNDVMGHSRTTDLKFPQRFAFPRAEDPITGALEGLSSPGGTPAPPPPPADIPSTAALPSPPAADPVDPAGLSNTPVDTAGGNTGHRAPAEPKEPGMPRVPTSPDYTSNVPVPGGPGPRPNAGSSDISSTDTL
ncbi:uncharacterized protein TRAVEDRAFT_42254 [Trametes versicolor FP-101664 SS1]|uniref:uncharacterized protein n=1 Tax=Trametes versicolor (strain FP-101664) TaxID=717944 RepID=UPI00046223AD|nr:uncharacterized protein TRAVEDRAFT_42254 [Trametes versicolor FP-101664 SS1]EIW64842.1 hypothetical protein TRAVEDRAFT_42254 [Trametes versicolor FP-101664 SS1]